VKAAPPAAPIKAPSEPVVTTPPPSGPPDPDNDESYRFATALPRCPNCQRLMAEDAVLCVGCGYNVKTGEKAVREYAPVNRTWDGELTYRRRLQLFGAVQALWLLALAGAFWGDFLAAGLFSWFLSSALLAFVVGTFGRIHVTRTRRGQVTLTRTWHVCLLPLPPTRIALYQYDGVTSGMAHGADLWDWVVFGTLLSYGILPGLVWWYWTFHKDVFYIGLTRGHGSMALELYRGWNEAATRDIAQVLRDVAGYP
jgi:hypothetical protein